MERIPSLDMADPSENSVGTSSWLEFWSETEPGIWMQLPFVEKVYFLSSLIGGLCVMESSPAFRSSSLEG